MWARHRDERTRRVTVALVSFAALVVVAGCSASRSARPAAPTIPPLTVAATATAPVTAAGSESPGATTTVAPAAATTTATTISAANPTATGATGPLAAITPEQWAAVDVALREELLGRGDFAFSLAVSVAGEPVHAGAYGIRNSPDMELPPEPVVSGPETTALTTTTTTIPPPEPEQVSTDDRLRIASISKMLTGTVVLQLIADGRLTLDDPVGARLGDFLGVDVAGQPVESITVRQLLSHTAGFGVFQRTFFERGVESCREAAARGLSNGLQFTPGTTYEYSNMNFCVLGQLIEAVTGQPYEQVVDAMLLQPLGIDGMRLAGTFDPNPDEVIHPSFPGRNYMETLGPAGGWMATPADIVTIIDSLDNTKPGWHPLPPELSELMRERVPGREYPDPLLRWYGLATIVDSNRSWGHTGTIENTHAIVIHRPDGMTWALFVSGNHPDDTDDLVEIFQRAVDGAGIDAPAPTSSTTTTTSTTTTSTTTTTTVVPAAAAPSTASATTVAG